MATSYSNPGGTGYRVGEIDLSTTATLGSGTFLTSFLNGVNNVSSSTSAWYWTGGQSGRTFTIDFQEGRSVVVDGFTWNQSASNTHGTWQFQGSNDGSTWTDIDSPITLGGATGDNVYTFSNTTGYRYYRLEQKTGTTSSSPWLRELTFRLEYLSSGHTSLHNAGGRGDRTGSITMSTDGSFGAALNNLIDGAFADNSTDSTFFTSGFGSNKEIVFDFGSGASKIIDRFVWRQSTTNTHGQWNFEGSNNGSSWTALATGFTLAGAGERNQVVAFTNTTGYRYYRLYGPTSGGVSLAPYLREIEFQIKDASVTFEDITFSATGDTDVTAILQAVANMVASITGETDVTFVPEGVNAFIIEGATDVSAVLSVVTNLTFSVEGASEVSFLPLASNPRGFVLLITN